MSKGEFRFDAYIEKNIAKNDTEKVFNYYETKFSMQFNDILREYLKDGRKYIVKQATKPMLKPSTDNNFVVIFQVFYLYLAEASECNVGDYLESSYFDIMFSDTEFDLDDIVIGNARFILNPIGWQRVE